MPDSTLLPLSAVRCPQCGVGKVKNDYACHTYQQGDQWMSCWTCDSAMEYHCAGEDPDSDDPGLSEGCGWAYTDGLNRGNPRSAANEAKKPDWVDRVETVRWREPIFEESKRLPGRIKMRKREASQ